MTEVLGRDGQPITDAEVDQAVNLLIERFKGANGFVVVGIYEAMDGSAVSQTAAGFGKRSPSPVALGHIMHDVADLLSGEIQANLNSRSCFKPLPPSDKDD